MPKDPARWNEVIIDSPFATLTKRDVHDYYTDPKIQQKILEATSGKETIVRQAFSPGELILRRKDPSGNVIRVGSPEKLEQWNQIRAAEFHPVFGRRTDTLLADIDPGTKVDWKTTKSIAETIAKTLDELEDVKNTQVFFSGDRGFYVRSQMDKSMGIDKARAKVQEALHGIAQRPDVTFGVAKPDQIRIDTTPLKYKGSVKAPFSLSGRTGLVSAPVELKDMPKIEKEDFTIEKIVKKAGHILITGSPGSGKTTVMEEMRNSMGLPTVHIDSVPERKEAWKNFLEAQRNLGDVEKKVMHEALSRSEPHIIEGWQLMRLDPKDLEPHRRILVDPGKKRSIDQFVSRELKRNPNIDLSEVRSRAHSLVAEAGEGVRKFKAIPGTEVKRPKKNVTGIGKKAESIDTSTLNPSLQKDLARALKSYEKVEDPAHGIGHIENVVRAANLMNQRFKLPHEQVMAAAILHDIGRRAEDLGKGRHEELGAKLAPRYLKGFDEPTRESIVHAIREHRFSKSNPQTPLAKMINDADTLSDFMSPTGKDYFFRRLFDYRKAHGLPQAEALPDSRAYAQQWLGKAITPGKLKTPEALDIFGKDLRRAMQITKSDKRWNKTVGPLANAVYAEGNLPPVKTAAFDFDIIKFLDMFDEHIPKFIRYFANKKREELAAQQLTQIPVIADQLSQEEAPVEQVLPEQGLIEPGLILPEQGLTAPGLALPETVLPEREKISGEEFAPGIPKSRKINSIPEIKNKSWTLAVQKHEALKAGPHFDFRLVDPETHQAHSFALPKMKIPKPGDPMVLAIQQPTHTEDYALHFEGNIPKGTYGAGKVTLPIKEQIQVIKSNANSVHLQRENGDKLVMFRTKDNNWGMKAKEK